MKQVAKYTLQQFLSQPRYNATGRPTHVGRGNAARVLKTATFVFVLTCLFFWNPIRRCKKENRGDYTEARKKKYPKMRGEKMAGGGGEGHGQLSQNWKSICKVDAATAWYIRPKLTCKHHKGLFPSCRRRWRLLPSVSCISIYCNP